MLWSTEVSGRVFWFLFEKMDKRYRYPDIPKFTDEEAETLARRYLDIRMTETNTFADLWENRVQFKLVALEEALHKKWTWERFVCAGDSAHKVCTPTPEDMPVPSLTGHQWTPNIGAGGNHAMESAAALANALHTLANLSETPTLTEIQSALTSYHSKRKTRAKAAFRVSNMCTRLEALRSRKGQFYALYLQPMLGDWLDNRMSMELIGSEAIEFLPLPPQSLTGSMGFNPDFSNGPPTKKKPRMLLALPLIVVAISSHLILSGILSSPSLSTELGKAVSGGRLEFDKIGWDLPTNKAPFNILVSVFAPSLLNIDPSQHLQALTFLVDLNPLWLIWILEGHRRANTVSFVRFSLIFGIACQFLGIGAVGPVWFFLHYVQSPPQIFLPRDWRMVNVAVSKAAMAAVLIGMTIPTLLMYLLSDYRQRLVVNVAWQAFPITTYVLLYLFRKFAVQDTTQRDAAQNIGADLPYIRLSITLAASISAMCFNWVRWRSAGQFSDIFVPQWSQVGAALFWQSLDLNLVNGMRLFFQIDELSLVASAVFWSALLIHDLKKESMTNISWLKAVLIGTIGICLVGPGATFATFWLWREEILASKTLKGTIVAQIN